MSVFFRTHPDLQEQITRHQTPSTYTTSSWVIDGNIKIISPKKRYSKYIKNSYMVEKNLRWMISQ